MNKRLWLILPAVLLLACYCFLCHKMLFHVLREACCLGFSHTGTVPGIK